MLPYYITELARAEIKKIRIDGAKEWGVSLAKDYNILIKQAIKDIRKNPHPLTARKIGKDLYAYPIQFSKKNAGVDIKKPPHSILYYTLKDKKLIIASVTRESRELHISSLDKSEAVKEMRDSGREDDGMER